MVECSGLRRIPERMNFRSQSFPKFKIFGKDLPTLLKSRAVTTRFLLAGTKAGMFMALLLQYFCR